MYDWVYIFRENNVNETKLMSPHNRHLFPQNNQYASAYVAHHITLLTRKFQLPLQSVIRLPIAWLTGFVYPPICNVTNHMSTFRLRSPQYQNNRTVLPTTVIHGAKYANCSIPATWVWYRISFFFFCQATRAMPFDDYDAHTCSVKFRKSAKFAGQHSTQGGWICTVDWIGWQ